MPNLEVLVMAEDAASIPEYRTDGSAGADIRAFLSSPVYLAPGARAAIPTGFRMALPEGYEAQIRPRSGLALEKGVTCLNSPGTIDSDYRGEIKVILVNLGDTEFIVRNGERIAQMVIAACNRAIFTPIVSLDETGRGVGGFGSTGIR